MTRMLFCFRLFCYLICAALLNACGGSSNDAAETELKVAVISNLTLSSNIVGTDVAANLSYASSAGQDSVKTTLSVVPAGSAMRNMQFAGSAFTATFDVVGEYTATVQVNDRAGSVSKDFTFTINNTDPNARVNGENTANLLTAYTLSGLASSDDDGHILSYQWSLLAKPEGSQVSTDLGATADVTLYPDKKGDYSVSLTVTDGFGGESTSTFDFVVGAFKFQRVVFNVIDAVYNASLDKLIVVGDDKKLYLYSPKTHDTEVISLGLQGNAVSVLPDGSMAAVGHNGKISYVNLATLQVEKVFPISTDVFDLEIAANGYVYAMPRTDQWETLRAINLANGEEVHQSGASVRAGTVIKMHPSQQYIYGADRGLSPSDIEKYDIRAGVPSYLYDSPYHGDYAMCGDLWMSQDGLRIFTKCGNVFRSSEVREQDMAYNGNLAADGGIMSLSHSQDSIAYIAGSETNFVNYYSYTALAWQSNEELPLAFVNEHQYPTYGRYIFHRADGSVVTLVEVDEAAGLLYNYGIAYIPTSVEEFNLKPVAIIDENKYVNINDFVEVSAESSFDPEGADLHFSWEIASKPESSIATLNASEDATVTFTPDIKGHYQIRVKVSDGVNESSYVTTTVTAEDPADKQLVELSFDVAASAYSKTLDKVVFLSSSPNQLVLFDIATGETEAIALTGSSSVLELNMSGTIAAVGYGNTVVLIDLTTKQVTNTYTVPTDIIDIALPDNGYLYVFPITDQWASISSVRLSDGAVSEHIGYPIYAGTRVDKHPSGQYLYGADNGLSPSDIELYDISAGTARYVNDSPYHGDYAMCGDIWVASDGNNLFTPCGNVFKANPGQSDDMQYVGKLTVAGRIKALSQQADEIAVVNTSNWWNSDSTEIGHMVHFYDYNNLTFTRSVEIPTLTINNAVYKNYGVNIFHSSGQNKVIVLAKVDAAAGKLYEYSLFIYAK